MGKTKLSISAELQTAQKRMLAADEGLARAAEYRDDVILLAVEEHKMSLAEIGRLLGIRRETVHYGRLRAEARRGQIQHEEVSA